MFDIFRKSDDKIQVSLKSDKFNGTVLYVKNNTHVYVISRTVLLRMRNVSGKVVEKMKTFISCSLYFFFRKSRGL
jgi:hypothetical protein